MSSSAPLYVLSTMSQRFLSHFNRLDETRKRGMKRARRRTSKSNVHSAAFVRFSARLSISAVNAPLEE
eukprot:6178461-Pleurochrysis_carterae.AAC.2